MRLSEAIGLHKDDIRLENQRPHIVLRTHKWRRLKTKGSERIIPLVGVSLWAAKRATGTGCHQQMAQTVQSRPSASGAQHETAGAGNRTTGWYIGWGLYNIYGTYFCLKSGEYQSPFIFRRRNSRGN